VLPPQGVREVHGVGPFLAEGLDEPLGPLVGSGVIQGLVLMCRTPRVR